MHDYTVLAEYYGSGQGCVVAVLLVRAKDAQHALAEFRKPQHAGDFLGAFGVVIEGFAWEHALVKSYVPAFVVQTLPRAMGEYYASFSYNLA